MAQVQIRCPRSGLWASIGLEVDPEHWPGVEAYMEVATCGVCGDTHTWSKREARIVDWSWT
jgi:hypothetical protein